MNSFVRSWDFPIMSCKVVTYYVTTKKDKCVLRIIGTYHFTYNSPISSITVQITVLEKMEKYSAKAKINEILKKKNHLSTLLVALSVQKKNCQY